MSFTVLFENPPGTVLTTRRFTPGQPLRIGAKLASVLGGPAPFFPCTFEVFGGDFTSIYVETQSDMWSNAWADVILPNVVTRATVRVVNKGSLEDTVEIPIGIGMEPSPITDPDDPLNQIWKYLPLMALALGAVYIATRRK